MYRRGIHKNLTVLIFGEERGVIFMFLYAFLQVLGFLQYACILIRLLLEKEKALKSIRIENKRTRSHQKPLRRACSWKAGSLL